MVNAAPTKRCYDCGKEKPLDAFHRKPGGKHGRQSICKPCKKEWNRKWRRQRLAENCEWETDRHLVKNYGITLDEYKAIEAEQGHRCAVCSSDDPKTRQRQGAIKSRFCVDHAHDTGAVRGLLCASCNRAIGLLGDDPQRLERAAAYLLLHRK